MIPMETPMRPWSLASLLRLRCPACGRDGFRAGWYRTAEACPHCGQVFERESGFYAGAIYPLYGGAVLLGGLAVLLLRLAFGWGLHACLAGAAAAVLLASPWLFWYARLSFVHTAHRFFREDA
jgi:uncharacterized protein (DUF983 family)